jgi:hypothetical protein
MATVKGIWQGTAANTALFSCIKLNPIGTGKANSAEPSSPTESSARTSLSKAYRTTRCVSAIVTASGALFEVTQPRVTCYRIGIRMNETQMAALLVPHNRPGFYFRVLEEGESRPAISSRWLCADRKP